MSNNIEMRSNPCAVLLRLKVKVTDLKEEINYYFLIKNAQFYFIF